MAMSQVQLNGTIKDLPGTVSLAPPDGTTTFTAIVSAEGDLMLQGSPGTQGWVEIHLVVDGNIVRILRTSAVNYIFGNMPSAWRVSTILTLTGSVSHDFKVEARTLSAAGGPMIVNSMPGNISVAYFKQ